MRRRAFPIQPSVYAAEMVFYGVVVLGRKLVRVEFLHSAFLPSGTDGAPSRFPGVKHLHVDEIQALLFGLFWVIVGSLVKYEVPLFQVFEFCHFREGRHLVILVPPAKKKPEVFGQIVLRPPDQCAAIQKYGGFERFGALLVVLLSIWNTNVLFNFLMSTISWTIPLKKYRFGALLKR